MGRNRTGPPWSVGRQIPTRPTAGAPTVHAPGSRQRYRRRRRQPAKQYWPIRRASNKVVVNGTTTRSTCHYTAFETVTPFDTKCP